MDSFDVHQHLWPETVLRVLERRAAAPRAQSRGPMAGGSISRASRVRGRPSDHDRRPVSARSNVDGRSSRFVPGRRRGAARAGGSGRGRGLARGRRGASGRLGWWAATPSALPRRGAGRASWPGALRAEPPGSACPPTGSHPRPPRNWPPLLAAAASAGAPVFVHPGPSQPGGGRRGCPRGGRPPLTTWASSTRPGTPSRRWCGRAARAARRSSRCSRAWRRCTPSAPPHAAARRRGGSTTSWSSTRPPPTARGPSRAMASGVGIGQLVHGSDYPVAGRGPTRRGGVRRGLSRTSSAARPSLARSATPGCRRERRPPRLHDTLLDAWAGRPELLAAARAPRPGRAHVRPASSRRRTSSYVVCWMPGHDTGFHDHDESAAAIVVLDGERERGAAVARRHRAVGARARARQVTIAPEAIHRVRHAARPRR